jgi:hypothetical protein
MPHVLSCCPVVYQTCRLDVKSPRNLARSQMLGKQQINGETDRSADKSGDTLRVGKVEGRERHTNEISLPCLPRFVSASKRAISESMLCRRDSVWRVGTPRSVAPSSTQDAKEPLLSHGFPLLPHSAITDLIN